MESNEPFYTQQVPERKRSPDGAAIDLLIHNRPRILRVKLAVLATQILERLRIRDLNQKKIAAHLLECANGLVPFDENLGNQKSPDITTRSFWREQSAKLSAESRTQDVECWRDVAQLMNEFLTVWEATEQSKVRAEFLREQGSEDDE